jgi:uncharacterized protein with GYD domain
VSSLWTPDGEYRPRPSGPHSDLDGTPAGGAADAATDDAASDAAYELDQELSEDEIAEAQERLADARARLAEIDPEVIVANHAMGLYELAAIHLSSDPPNLRGASLAIDAFGAIVDNVGDRLGPDAATLRDALVQIRMVFVEMSRS